MSKIRVVLSGTIGKSVLIESKATIGATIGTDLRLADGTVPTLAQLAALIALETATETGTLATTIWPLIGEIPQNVVEVEELTTVGLVTRQTSGDWVTRSIVSAGAQIVVTNGDGDAANPTIGFGIVNLDELADVVITAPASGEVLRYNGATWENLPLAPSTRGITIENPIAADNFTLFFTDVAITVAQLNFVLQGTTDATVFVSFGPDRSVLGTEVVNAGTVVSSTTTGQELTSFDNAAIPANSWVAVRVTAITGTPDELNVSVVFS